MGKKPVKRSPYIVKLSRDHHAGLLFCWKIRQGIKSEIDNIRMKNYVSYFYREHLTPHFSEEEKILFAPALNDGMVIQALHEHQQIKEIAINISNANAMELDVLLNEIADTVDQHIRFEERVLFPHLEKLLSEAQLIEISTLLDHPPAKDTYPDEFWIKKRNK